MKNAKENYAPRKFGTISSEKKSVQLGCQDCCNSTFQNKCINSYDELATILHNTKRHHFLKKNPRHQNLHTDHETNVKA